MPRHWWVWFHCPPSEVSMLIRGIVSVRCPEVVRFFKDVRFLEVPCKCTIYMVRSIGGRGFVRCTEVVRFSESPLLEVSLYKLYLLHQERHQYRLVKWNGMVVESNQILLGPHMLQGCVQRQREPFLLLLNSTGCLRFQLLHKIVCTPQSL